MRNRKRHGWCCWEYLSQPTGPQSSGNFHLSVARPHLERGVRRLDIGKPDSAHKKEWNRERPENFQTGGNLVLIFKWKRVQSGSIVLGGQQLVCREIRVGLAPEKLPHSQTGCAEESGSVSGRAWASRPPWAPARLLGCQWRVFFFASGWFRMVPSALWLWVLCSCCLFFVFCYLHVQEIWCVFVLSPLYKRFYFQ